MAPTDQAGFLEDSGVADLCGADLTEEPFSIVFKMLFDPEVVLSDKEDAEDVSASLRILFAQKSFNSLLFSCSNSFLEIDSALMGSSIFALHFFSFLERFLVLPCIFCFFCSCSLYRGLFTFDEIL